MKVCITVSFLHKLLRSNWNNRINNRTKIKTNISLWLVSLLQNALIDCLLVRAFAEVLQQLVGALCKEHIEMSHRCSAANLADVWEENGSNNTHTCINIREAPWRVCLSDNQGGLWSVCSNFVHRVYETFLLWINIFSSSETNKTFLFSFVNLNKSN